MTYAKVILDSISPTDKRVTTIEVKLHRFVLAEFNTHRAFSRNSASSRAIPLSKQIERVMEDPAIPVAWASEQKGMQGGDEIERTDIAESLWLRARNEAVNAAQGLANTDVHKSIANRLLEPFMWQTIICTATEWSGFWQQRCSPLAQPEIRVAAEAMREAYEASTPQELHYDEWHTPYIQPDELRLDTEVRKRISAARCARVSYLTHDGTRSLDADLSLYNRLVTAEPPHWSPLEHVATPAGTNDSPPGNLRGWWQLRHIVEMQRPVLPRVL